MGKTFFFDDEGPQPASVVGYSDALRAGLLPRVPESPPDPVAGASAKDLALRVFVRFVVGLICFVALGKLSSAVIGWTPGLRVATLATGLTLLFLTYRAWGRGGERHLEELRHGYATLNLAMGQFWVGALRKWRGYGPRVPWDLRGAWLLRSDGTVIRQPDRTVTPPGLYPSPNRRGRWEVWSGIVWTGEYKPTPPGALGPSA